MPNSKGEEAKEAGGAGRGGDPDAPGLRERKKLRTSRAIREAARRLLDERGYDNTTIEQIAAAAEVSPSTVFRYFPSRNTSS
ncbi:helix-turn-helix domain-containing protein [Streptomyces sp. NPDC032940]|uniref:TetR/AcrR family transcriptional regulator n=1 Tax=Streptomyces sp. NPDC032940 TaxID=3155366 RepID=UPI0033EEFB7B